MTNNLSASEWIRTASQVPGRRDVLFEVDGWQIVRFENLAISSYLWVVSQKGYLWEPFEDEEHARTYIENGCPE